MFDVSRDSPFILFMKDAEKSMAGNSESHSIYKSKLDKLPNNVVIIGSQTQTDNRKEKVQSVDNIHRTIKQYLVTGVSEFVQ